MRTRAFSVLFLSLVICQCGSVIGKKVETRTVWESGEEYIRLFKEVGGNRGYHQPAHFHEEDMRKILLSLYYAKYQLFRWSTSSRVFQEAQAKKLAPFFQRAFLEAGPNDVVEFYLPRRAKKLLGVSGQVFLTRGLAFVQGEKLHFQFANIEQQMRTYATDSDDQKPLPPTAWKLIPQQGQAYGREPGAAGRRSENIHWLTIDLRTVSLPGAGPTAAHPPAVSFPDDAPSPATQSSARQEAAPKGSAAPAAAGSVSHTGARDKLRELKHMLKEGLITQQDYNRKKKEILDSF